jgi:putative phage-type endonuclease
MSELFPDAAVILPIPYLRPQWLETRLLGIGGSDAASAIGCNPYQSALELWQIKTRRATGDTSEPGPEDARWWGLALEDDLTTAFEHTTGLDTALSPGLLANVARPWQFANLDRVVVDAHKQPLGILELKTTALWHAAKWSGDQLPLQALVQVQHYLAVTGAPRAWIAGLIGGQRFVVKQVERDEALIDMLNDREAEFWGHVTSDVAPSPDGSKSAREALMRQYPQAVDDDDDGVTLGIEELDAIRSLRETQTEIDRLNGLAELLKQQICAALGPHEVGYDGERAVVHWRNVKGPARWDTTTLARDHPELARTYRRQGNPTRRFSLVKEDD